MNGSGGEWMREEEMGRDESRLALARGDWLSQEYIQSGIWSVDDEDIVNRPKLPSRRFSQGIRIVHRVRSVRNNA
ncbi:hypothetical protein HZ326_13374 [Fusarium oxysporum f. sp. albedinis]|nr:hypothetical protein HZ326_13374 [Fusarium oxysporum f. sp. albedinis]